jgi:hypothetical protein
MQILEAETRYGTKERSLPRMRLCSCVIHKELITRLPVRLKRLSYILICSEFERWTYTCDDFPYFFCWGAHGNDYEWFA